MLTNIHDTGLGAHLPPLGAAALIAPRTWDPSCGSNFRDPQERSAAAAFRRLRVRGTAAGTGILIYVSLYERMVRVLGDDAINARVTQADWDTVCRLAVDGLRTGRSAEGLADAIRKAGELLSRHFPVQPGDRNEIVNELQLID